MLARQRDGLRRPDGDQRLDDPGRLAARVADGRRRRFPVPAGSPAFSAFVYSAHVVRYLIANAIDPIDTAPCLWRSDTGRYTPTGRRLGGAGGRRANWQMVARGIEDLQVEYLNGNGLWSNNPGVIHVCAPPAAPPATTTTSSAACASRSRPAPTRRCCRARRRRPAAPAPNAVRGQLVSVASPRAAVLGLQSVHADRELLLMRHR